MTDIQEVIEAECPYCAEKINSRAKKCKHCGEILDSTMRELELLKSHKKDVYVTNNSASSASATAVPQPVAVQALSTSMANWAIGLCVLCLFINGSLATDSTLTSDDAFGATIISAVPVILGIIVLNSERSGKNRARFAIVLTVFSILGVWGHVP